MPTPLSQLAIIVIGRNESSRLAACLEALATVRASVIYVDSGSTDGSPEIAAASGVHVITLAAGPYTAARGRQVGLDAACRRQKDLRYVQFVDGDCVLQPGWLGEAVSFLDDNPQVAAVSGRLRESHAPESLLLRLVDMDWDQPLGEVATFGGIVVARVSAIRSAGGWSVDLIAGEEADLATRLRDHGWRLHRLPADMARHDIGIRSVWELWRRSVRTGYAYAQLAHRYRWHRGRRWIRRAASNLVYGGLAPALLLVLLFLWWPASVAIGAIYPLLVVRVTWQRVRRGDLLRHALPYALVLAVGKFAGVIGMARFLAARLTGHRTRLIEYKAPATAAGE